MHPDTGLATPDASAAPPEAPEAAHAAQAPSLRFTATGRAYFRIWIVNLLRTVLTLGLYLPFARARQLRHFHEHTLVDGSPLSFDGDPWKMLRGHLIVGAVVAGYLIGSEFAPMLALAVALAGTAAWPWLMCSALRFRLGHVRWRGRPLGFSGTVAEAYRVFLPMIVPVAVLLGLTPLLASSPELAEDAAVAQGPSAWLLGAVLLCTLAAYLAGPWTLLRMLRYRHGHFTFAGERTRLEGVRLRDLYTMGFKSMLVLMVLGLALGAAGIAATMVLPPLALVAGPLGYMAIVTAMMAYSTSRMQNLAWSHTCSQHLRFDSQLSATALWMLLMKNALLTVLTLGLYWPFAAVAVARLRLESVTIRSSLPLDQLAGAPAGPGQPAGTIGDAAGELLGLDVAL